MLLQSHVWGIFLLSLYCGGYLLGLSVLVLGQDSDLEKEYYEPENPADEFVNQAVHDYFVAFLPRCPNSYQISIQNVNVTNTKSNLRSGNYNLCQSSGKARLRECSSQTKPCAVAGEADYWLSIRPSSFSDVDAASQNNELLPGKGWEGLKSDCRPKDCSRNQLMAINMKNPMDCSSFYICIMGNHFLLHCPLGHQFSEEYGVCIENKYTNCKLSSFCVPRY